MNQKLKCTLYQSILQLNSGLHKFFHQVDKNKAFTQHKTILHSKYWQEWRKKSYKFELWDKSLYKLPLVLKQGR